MAEYFIRCRATGAVVNAVNTQKSKAELEESQFFNNDEYYLDPNPPMDVLMRYQYWNERP